MAQQREGIRPSSRRQRRITSIIPTNPDILASETSLVRERDHQSFLKTHEFERRTDKTIAMRKISDFVATGMAAYEEDLKARRLQLRNMILAEEAELMNDVAAWVQRAALNKAKEKKMAAEIVHAPDEDKCRAATISIQQKYSENSSEFRSGNSRELTRDVKLANLAQITEKRNRICEKNQSDRMWHEIMLNDVEAQQRDDETTKRKLLEKNKQTSTILLEQMRSTSESGGQLRESCDEERKKFEELQKQIELTEINQLACKRMKCNKLKQDLQEQILLAKRRSAENNHNEVARDRQQMLITATELAEEKAEAAKKLMSSQKEMKAYMESLGKFQQHSLERKSVLKTLAFQSA